MHIPDGTRYMAFGLGLALSAACGDGESTAGRAVGPSGSGGAGGSAKVGAGADAAASGGNAGLGSTGGGGVVAVDGAGGSVSAAAGASGVPSTAGAAGESATPSEPCAGLPTCDSPGWACDGNTLVNCAETVNGCLLEMRTDCGSQICVEGETVRCDNQGRSCADPWPVAENTVIRGTSFAADFGDGQDFVGVGCPSMGAGSSYAVFAVQVPQGATVVVTEVGEHYGDTDTSIDASFAVLSACSDDAACLTSANGPDPLGITYSAEHDETIYVWVGAEVGADGAYEVRIEYATHLGQLELGDSVSVAEGADLSRGDLRTYYFELGEPGVMHGTLSAASEGDLDLAYVYDESGDLVFNSLTYGSEDFAVPLEPGSYRVVIFAYSAARGYTLELSADPLTELGDFDVGETFAGDFTYIAEGRSEFYHFFQVSTATIEWTVSNIEPAGGGRPDLSAYFRGRLLATAPGLDAVASLVGTANPGDYLLRVLAAPGTGEIPAHQLELTFEDL